MPDNARWEQLRAAFRAEIEDRIPALSQLLVRLESSLDAASRSEILATVLRDVHSLKGAARAVELPRVERLAHAMESALQAAANNHAAPSPEWFGTLLRAVDALAAGHEDGDWSDAAECRFDATAGRERTRVGRQAGCTPRSGWRARSYPHSHRTTPR
jgi:two-component system chemotaxis sensor kinase CheA